MIKLFGRILFVLVAFIPVLLVDGWHKAVVDAKEYIKGNA